MSAWLDRADLKISAGMNGSCQPLLRITAALAEGINNKSKRLQCMAFGLRTLPLNRY